jgi:hypothetical protein
MLSPINAAPLKDFNPFARSPAVCLTDHLPSNVPAHCLLLSAGDPRHVFYTIHCENVAGRDHIGFVLILEDSKRVLDFTCADEEAAILGMLPSSFHTHL